MWVSQRDKWHSDSTIYERFFIEKMIQRCDFNESIGNRHKTTNGYVQVKEFLNLIKLTELRGKSVKTLEVLGMEANSKYFKQNIGNDIIIDKYFTDLKMLVSKFSFEALISNRLPNLIKVKELKHLLQLHEFQIDRYYLESTLKEFNNLDFEIKHFGRHAKQIESLVDIYVTYLIFNGYSSSTITSFLCNQLTKGKRITFQNFTKVFNFKPKNSKHYLALEDITDDISDFAELLNSDYKIKVNETGKNKILDDQLNNKPFLSFTHKSLDANSFIRSLYDELLKKLVIKRDRESLNSFNSFFDLAYWSHLQGTQLFKADLIGDPINVKKRERTLLKTLNKTGIIPKAEKTELPLLNNSKLNNAIYYYNLALGSKSIENSLSLLWTALESSIPYRTAESDVVCVRNIISKLLSLGCISRSAMALATRFQISKNLNSKLLKGTGVSKMNIPKNNEDLLVWMNWLKENNTKRFEKVVQSSDLLAYDYSHFGQLLESGTAKDLLNRILASKYSLDFQIQRIYIHRNQIIHAGDFINEYTNLWMNIEWYTGKLLAFMLTKCHQGECIHTAVQNLESDYDYLVSYLEKNKSKKISELPERISGIIQNQFWQSF